MLNRTYRPAAADFHPRNVQQLSCRAGGQLDHKNFPDRAVPATGWGAVSKRRSHPESASQKRRASRRG